MQFAIALQDLLMTLLSNSDLNRAATKDRALKLLINEGYVGGLTGGTVRLTIDDIPQSAVDTVMEQTVTIPLAAGVNINEPIF